MSIVRHLFNEKLLRTVALLSAVSAVAAFSFVENAKIDPRRDIAAIPKHTNVIPTRSTMADVRLLQNNTVLVAIIDTGVDYSHPAIRDHIYINAKEDRNGDNKCTEADNDGIDNDNDGLIDDCSGWNFSAGNNNPMDNHGHGTHIAGIIAAISKIFPEANIKILPLKYYDPSIPRNHIQNTVNAIDYAIKMGAQIINYSAGGDTPSEDEKRAILRARDKGVLFVAAAGNEQNNVEKIPYYPSSYHLPNIISVTAIDQKGELLNKSNWGISIDIAAPGYNVLSALPKNRYGNMSGTSMAASFISGLAAVIMARDHCNPLKAAELIKESALSSSKLSSKVAQNRIVNPSGALGVEGKDADIQRKIEKIFTTASAL